MKSQNKEQRELWEVEFLQERSFKTIKISRNSGFCYSIGKAIAVPVH